MNNDTETAAPAQARAPLDVKLMVPFVNAIRQAFAKMVGVPVTIQRPSIKSEPTPVYDVSGVIGFTGEILGSVVVSFRKATAAKLLSSFAAAEIDPSGPDFADGVGELTNIIVGGAKKDLGANASITCPTVIMGTGHTFAKLKDVPCLMIPCETVYGPFAVEVNVKQARPNP